MVVFPNCKINLGLSVLRKRPDNYHDLQTVFYPLPFYDVLEIVRSGKFSMSQTGITLDVNPPDNICVRAWDLLKKDFPALPEVDVLLHKMVPVGAGLGGGSADAAFVLILANKKFRLGLTDNKLMEYALQLGSDCPFFILNKPAVATGRGEGLQPLSIDLSPYNIVIVNPGIHVNTKQAFEMIRPNDQATDLREILSLPVAQWTGQLINDFETPVFGKHPEIKAVKDTLYEAGAVYASMSGSGSTVFGLFEKESTVPVFPGHYLEKVFPC